MLSRLVSTQLLTRLYYTYQEVTVETAEKQKFRLLPEWKIDQTGKSLVISGGADAKYEIELDEGEASFFASLKPSRTFRRSALRTPDQRVLEQLVTAEIVVPILQQKKKMKVRIMGDVKKLSLVSAAGFSTASESQPYDLALIVRSTSTYAELLSKIQYEQVMKPHLFLDIAFHHTASIGPLVFPGETACIACLQGRITTRWGDDAPPKRPRAVTNYLHLASALVANELDRIAQGDTSLTNKTLAWNFQDRTIKNNQLLKVPVCPICSRNRIDQNGALALPWSKDASPSNSV